MEVYEEVIDHHCLDEITLRPFVIEDVDDLMVWATDDKVTRYLRWSPYTSMEQGLEFLKNNVIPHPYSRAICMKSRAIGSITVTPNNEELDKCRAELGYVLASNYWGKGIATKVVKMVVSAAFREWPELENVASQRVLEKVGFKKEGVLRKYVILKGETIDVAIFSLLSTDLSNV